MHTSKSMCLRINPRQCDLLSTNSHQNKGLIVNNEMPKKSPSLVHDAASAAAVCTLQQMHAIKDDDAMMQL